MNEFLKVYTHYQISRTLYIDLDIEVLVKTKCWNEKKRLQTSMKILSKNNELFV